MTKRIKVYGFRQLMRLSEKERKELEIKSQSQKEIIIVGYGKIKEENIDIKEMHEECIKLIEKELHYKRYSLDWFDWEHQNIEYPKPYPANRPDRWEEKWSKTKK